MAAIIAKPVLVQPEKAGDLCDSKIFLPELRSSFPAALHPLHLKVQSICEPWILRVADPPTPKHGQFLRDCLLPRYVCRLYPQAPVMPRLCSLTKLIAWFTLADDIADSLPSSDSAEIWSSKVLSVLEEPLVLSGSSAATSGSPSTLLAALSQIWLEISPDMPGPSKNLFLLAARRHLDAVCLQSSLRSSPSPPHLTFSQYMSIRRPASGFPMGFELAPYALSITSGFDVLHHPLLAELRCLTIDHMCICNDVLSCRMEIQKGDYTNLPCVLYRSGEASSLQEAVDCAAQMVNDIDSRSVELVQLIREDKELMQRWRPTVEAYVAMLVSCMAGTIAWSHETARYGLSPKASPSPRPA